MRTTNRRPSRTWPCSASSTGGSSGRIERSSSADPTNDAASARSAAGADSNWTRTPPMLGPATNEKARLPLTSEFPSTYCSRGTRRREQDVDADEERDRERAREEGDDVQVRHRQHVQPVRGRHRREQRGAAPVGPDHRLAAPPAAVDERAGVEREQEVRQRPDGREQPHLPGARVEREHGHERQRDPVDLVAEVRDRLRRPEAAERQVAEQRRDEPRAKARPLGEIARHPPVGYASRISVTSRAPWSFERHRSRKYSRRPRRQRSKSPRIRS